MKTFEELWAELSEKAQTRPEGSGTVRQLDAGVHAIGKKLVEEAAESWMAAEHEGPERAAEEISQLLYHAQVLMLASGLDARRRLRPPLGGPAMTQIQSDQLLRVAVPNKGSLSQAAAEILRESGYRQRHDSKELRARRRRERRRVLLPAPARHRAVRRRGHPRRRHHRPRPAARLRRQGRGGAARSASAAAGSTSPARAGAVRRPRPSSPASGSPRRTSAWSARFLEERGIEATVTRLDGAVETSIQLGVADVIADVVETGSTLRAGRPGDVRRGDPRVRGGAGHPRRRGARRASRSSGAGSRASWSPAAT